MDKHAVLLYFEFLKLKRSLLHEVCCGGVISVMQKNKLSLNKEKLPLDHVISVGEVRGAVFPFFF